MKAVRESRTIYDVKHTMQVIISDEEAALANFALMDEVERKIKWSLDKVEKQMICYMNGHARLMFGGPYTVCTYCGQGVPE